MPDTGRELLEELQAVLGARLIDAIVPPLLFVIVYRWWDFRAAVLTALTLSVLFGIRRKMRGESLLYSLLGVGSVLLAIGLVFWFARAESFFLPGVFSAGLTVVLGLLSLLIGRPLTAWSSYIARRWELDWYWHPRVRPAYTETTLLWTLFFGLKFWWQLSLYQGSQADKLAWVQALSGWPALLVLLVVTYLYGVWRLRQLAGPGVDEFVVNAPPPWEGQSRGF